jgi:hypothetical protein
MLVYVQKKSYIYFVNEIKIKHKTPFNMENLVGQMVEVIVSKNGKIGSKTIKVCKVKSRSVLFIEVDKPNRKNIFWKVDRKNIEKIGEKTNGEPFILMVDGILLSDNKWESDWDSIGQLSPMSFNNRIKPQFSNHSKGWAPSLPSTTNSSAGFPMV